MSVTECANGHIYDPDIYSSCPYCNNGGTEITFDSTTSARRGAGYPDQNRTLPLDGMQRQGTLPLDGAQRQGTLPLDGAQRQGTLPLDGMQRQGTLPLDGAQRQGSIPLYRAQGQETIPLSHQGAPQSDPWQASALPDRDPGRNSNGRNTEIIGRRSSGIIPVAGWIVCLKGPVRGQSYTLYCKQNTIGRDRDRDVCIQGDNTISGHQANIAYDMKHNIFTIVPKTETNTMYLNDEPVYEAAKLKAHDLIEMGRSIFVFIPFCGERYTWKEENA